MTSGDGAAGHAGLASLLQTRRERHGQGEAPLRDPGDSQPRARGGSHPRDNAGRGGADVQTMALAHPAPLPAFPSPGGREGAPGRPARLRATHPGRGRD